MKNDMEKYIYGAAASVVSFFAPVGPMTVCAVAFVAIDFVTGVMADRSAARRAVRKWSFESNKAWRTVTKLSFVMAGIMLAFMLEKLLRPVAEIRLAGLFTGFVCGVEFWSYLENASVITGAPVFRLFADRFRNMFERVLKITKDKENQ